MHYVIDVESTMDHNTIWLVVTRCLETGEVLCHREASSLRKSVGETDRLIAHNVIGFDRPILNRVWGMTIPLSQCEDTLVMSQLDNPTREGGHSLASWGARFGIPKGDFTDFDGGWTQEMEDYCVQDTLICQRVYEELTPLLKGQVDALALEQRVRDILDDQQRYGFHFNVTKATTLYAELLQERNSVHAQLVATFPPTIVKMKTKDKVVPFNPGSRQQLAKALIGLGWKPKRLTPTGSPMINEGILSKLDLPEAKLAARYFLLAKRVGELEGWFNAVKEDGRIHGKVWTMGTGTFRMSHTSPNMAQVPNSKAEYGPDCRDLFGVPDGKILVGGDAQALELRMLAHYMRDDEYIHIVCNEDVHIRNMEAAGLTTRDQAKTFIYAFIYGAGDAKLGSIVGGSKADGAALRAKFLSSLPALGKLIKRLHPYATSGQIPALDGRILRCDSEHKALNYLLQSAGAIVMKRALVICDDTLRRKHWSTHFVANVHDEWQVESDFRYGYETGIIMVSSMKEAGKYFNLRCPMDGNFKVGDTWKTTH